MSVFADMAFFQAPADMSKANAALASAMGVTHFPCCHLFRSMKVLRSLTDCSSEALSSALAQCGSATASVDASSNSNGDRQQTAETLDARANGTANGSSAADAGRSTGASASGSGVHDPPTGKEARAGATRMMPGGKTGYFW